MEFGRYLEKGAWGTGAKVCVALYGLFSTLIAIRTIPVVEYGIYAIVQSVFIVFSSTTSSLAIQPLVKFVSEGDDYGEYIAASGFYFFGFTLVGSLFLFSIRIPLAELLEGNNTQSLIAGISLAPALVVSSSLRLFMMGLLQARLCIEKIFWIELSLLSSSLLFFFVAHLVGMIRVATDVIWVLVLSNLVSSILAVAMSRSIWTFRWRLSKEKLSSIWNFGKFTFLSSVCFSIYSQLDVFLVASLSGITQVAIYNAARVFTRIFDIYNQIVQLFLVPLSSRRNHEGKKGDLRLIVEKSILFSLVAFIPVILSFVFFSEDLIRLLYGIRYAEAAPVLAVLSILALTTPWHAVFGSVLVGIGQVKIGFYLSLLFIGFSLGLYFVFVPFLGALGAAISVSSSGIVLAIAISVVSRKFVPFTVASVFSRFSDITAFIRRRKLY